MSLTNHPIADQIEQEYRQRTPRSVEYYRSAQEYLPGGDSRTITYFTPHPLYMEGAEGPRMTDVDGNVYLDFLGNYTSIIHGHGHPALTKAIAEQAARGTAYAACVPAQITLAKELCRRVASVEQVRFCNSGTEATMNALRAARAFTGRNKILKMEGGYHGSHDLAEISVAPSLDQAGPAEAPHAVAEEPGIPQAVVEDVVIAPFNDAEAVEAIFARHGEGLAAVIVEPMMGAAGMIPAEEGFLSVLRQLCDKYGALLIFDEVITFRLDYGGAQALYNVPPDLTSFGKIIGGGLPVGAFGGRADIMALFAPPKPKLVQSGTFNANPLTMVAGVAAMELLTREEIARINQLGTQLATGLQHALDEMQLIAQVTGLGSLYTVHFTNQPVRDYRSKATTHPDLSRLTHLALLNRGIFAAQRCMFVTSTAMNETDVDTCIAAFAEVLSQLRPYIADQAPHLLLS
ncbi:MAG: aspartate aminotransferase family protein [Ardenticatenaceae bacterium]